MILLHAISYTTNSKLNKRFVNFIQTGYYVDSFHLSRQIDRETLNDTYIFLC